MTILTMERDYTTGNLTLAVKKKSKMALTHSLWKITTVREHVNSRSVCYETWKQAKLTFDEFNALNLNGTTNAKTAVKK